MSVMHFEYTKNFWKEFPDFKLVKEFGSVYSKDKSREKVDSSHLMWAIHLCYHPDSVFYNIPNKQELITKDFYKKELDWDKIKYLTDIYVETTLSEAHRSLIMWEKQMNKRRAFLDDTEYSLDNAKELDVMAAQTFKLYQEYDRIKKLLKEESTKDNGRPQSLSDTGEI